MRAGDWKYFWKTLLLFHTVPALALSVLSLVLAGFGYLIGLPFVFVFAGRWATRGEMPQRWWIRWLPALLPLLVQVVSWTICYALAEGSLPGMIQSGLLTIYGLCQPAFYPMVFLALVVGAPWLTFWLPLVYHLVFLFSFAYFERRREERPSPSRRGLVVAGSVLILAGCVTAGFYAAHRAQVLPPDYGTDYGGGYASVDLWAYDPANPDNVLPKLDAPSSFTLPAGTRPPVLDGAEAAYPVYAAFAQACYEELPSDPSAVTFTNTIYAFERLLSGEVDIFFGAEPSAAQRELAERAGKELVLTPIGKEAFVFFVSRENPVEGLSTEQIRAIYTGELTDWSSVTGRSEQIFAFQRPANSGSQTILEKIMGDMPIMPPLQEEYASGMGEITERVANFRAYPGSIGYSFRFFLTGMTADADAVRMLAIDGVQPDEASIQSGRYPFTVSLYAITLADNPLESLPPFLQWMRGAQGQKLVEAVGYVPLFE